MALIKEAKDRPSVGHQRQAAIKKRPLTSQSERCRQVSAGVRHMEPYQRYSQGGIFLVGRLVKGVVGIQDTSHVVLVAKPVE